MSKVIRISDNLYQRLSFHAKGFDTPASVIERLLDFYEKNIEITIPRNSLKSNQINEPAELQIIYYPINEEEFKKNLLKTKKAYILLHKVDGTTEIKTWNAYRFGENSNVSGNLRSGRLRDWKKRGIYKAEVSVNLDDFHRSKNGTTK